MNLGVIVFAHTRYTIMKNEVFAYLEIYSVYLEIYYYGVLVQGRVRFPDEY